MKDLFALLLGGDLFNHDNNGSMKFPKDDDPNWSKTEEITETKTHTIKVETWTAKDNSCKMQRSTSTTKNVVDVKRLKSMLDKAVANEDYEKAAELRDKIKAAEL